MGRIPKDLIEKIIERNDIVDIVSEFVPLRKTGRSYMGVCPFHNDKGPSLSVSQEKQLFHCFGCGASGNVIGFVMRIKNLDYLDAISYLADRANVPLEFSEDDKNTRENAVKEQIYRANVEAARFFFSNLKRSNKAITYLKSRNVESSIIFKFGIGYSIDSWNSLYIYLKSKGFSDEILLKAGLIVKSQKDYYDRFRNRIMFPVIDVKGRIIGFGGRVLDDSKPKYLNSPETPVFKKGTNLYGLNLVAKQGNVENLIIVEGYMDCITLHQYGINNAVASLGTALTMEQAKLLKRYSKDIYICYDADAAGKAATLRGLDILESVGCNVKIIEVPKGKDPDEFIKSFGVDEFKKVIENSLPVLQYRIEKAKDGKNLKDVNQKIVFINDVANILSEVENPIDVQVYAAKVFDETGIEVQSILEQVKKLKNNKINKNNRNNMRNNIVNGNVFNIEPAYRKAERLILNLCIKDIELYGYISKKIIPKEFITDEYKKAAEYIYNKCEKGEKIDANEILIEFESDKGIGDVASIFIEYEYSEDLYELADDLIKTIKKYNLENKIDEINEQIKSYEEANDIEKSAILSKELIELRRQLSLL
ncbi:DNA primase [Caloramator sp. E03]|uniref:DNA primase n=1 Tax=Caloramator sp. E03 TaxID=2576307 RepID=UPI001110C538|nr:DNA primase [Caloramator sp. E03]QCX32394.1 DNA primase [Caloramator sp. E03]